MTGVKALRRSQALRPRLRRGCGIDGVCAQLEGRRLRMAALHGICRARLDGEVYGDYSADVFLGVSTTPLRLETQADSGPVAALQRDTALSKNHVT